MKNFITILLTLITLQICSAQYTEVINSRRPGFSDSPFGVGTDVLQVESGLFYGRNSNENDRITSFGTDMNFRYGKFFEKLEVNLDLIFQNTSVKYDDTSIPDSSKFNLSKLTLGGKYLVYSPKYLDRSKEVRSWKKKYRFDWNRLIPAVGVYAGANIPVTQNYVGGRFDRFVDDKFSPRIAIFTQNNFTDKFNFVMNLVADKIFTDERENQYILTATYSLVDKFSIFGEHRGLFKKEVPNDYQFGGGVAYLINRNMQVDAATRTIIERDGSSFSFNVGFSWRLDRHKDDYKIIGSDGEVAEGDEKKSGLLKRIFGKKNKKQRKVKKIKARKRKIKKDKPKKKSKAQKRREKEAKKKAKSDKKQRKRDLKSYKKNYDPDKDNEDDEQ